MLRVVAPLIFLAFILICCHNEEPGDQQDIDKDPVLLDSADIKDPIIVDHNESPEEEPEPEEDIIYGPPKNLIIMEDAIHFYVFGDFGRNGLYGQSELAHMMDTTSLLLPPDFIVGTGDNFYPDGVSSTSDPHWSSSFENVYSSQNGLNCPWYMVLGNHDYHSNMQAQFDYSDLSDRWVMPSYYYHRDFEKNGTSIRMVFLDTNPFVDPYYTEGKFKNKVILQDTTYRVQWMDSLFSDESRQWKIVVGHHPIYSGDYRGDEMRSVRNHLEPHLKDKNVNVYFNGHEHVIHHAKADGPTHYITSGTGSKVSTAPTITQSLFAASESAFVITSVNSDSIFCQVVNYKGQIIYQTGIRDTD